MPELLGVTSTVGNEPERYHLLQLSKVGMRVDKSAHDVREAIVGTSLISRYSHPCTSPFVAMTSSICTPEGTHRQATRKPEAEQPMGDRLPDSVSTLTAHTFVGVCDIVVGYLCNVSRARSSVPRYTQIETYVCPGLHPPEQKDATFCL